MPSSCKVIRQELIDCMLKSECVLKGRTIKECFQPEHVDEVPSTCQSIRRSFFECRRGIVSVHCVVAIVPWEEGATIESQTN